MAPACSTASIAPRPRSARLRPRTFCAALCLAAAFASSIGPDGRSPIAPLGPDGQEMIASDQATQRLRREAELRTFWTEHVEPHLTAADARTQLAGRQSIEAIRQWFTDRKEGSKPFAESALSLRSKWNLARSKLPGPLGGKSNAHRDYLNRQFAEHVFSPDEFRKAIEAAAAFYADQVQATENDLLVALRADLDDFPLEDLPGLRSALLSHDQFERVIREVTPAVARDLGLDCVREVTSFAVSEVAAVVLTAAVTRLGVSTGILAAGAGTSWATLGVSLVAAVAIDHVVGRVIDYVRDPTGQLARQIDTLLDEFGGLVIEGDPATPGLRSALSKFDATRSHLRHEALRRLILDTSEPQHHADQSLTLLAHGE